MPYPSPLRILLVDDAEFQYTMICDFLSDSVAGDFVVDWAETLEAGREKMQNNTYDICLIDYAIGPQNGLNLLREMAAQGYPAPMILLTGQGSHDIDLEAMGAGATDYLDKLELTPSTLERSIRYAVEHARIEHALQASSQSEHEQRKLAEALLDTVLALNSTLDLNDVFNRILANIGKVVPNDVANVLLIEAGEARIVDCYGAICETEEHRLRTARFNVLEIDAFRQMIETNQPLVVPTIIDDTTGAHIQLQLPLVRSYVGAPISQGDEVIGFIMLYSFSPGFFSQIHGQPLFAFANQAAIAINNARTFQQAQKLAALEERQRLARDLHDAVSQTLFSASFIADSLPHLIKNDPQEAENSIDRLSRLTKGALMEMRMLLMELRPHSLEEADLEVLIQHLANALPARTEADVSLVSEGEHCLLPGNVKLGLYRIMQEALNNVARHAHATRVVVALRSSSNFLELEVLDDGRGFVPSQIDASHMGLRIMRERADGIHAAVEVASTPGQGTRVLIHYPAEMQENGHD